MNKLARLKVQSSGDATLAESRYDIGFRGPGEPSLRQPC